MTGARGREESSDVRDPPCAPMPPTKRFAAATAGALARAAAGRSRRAARARRRSLRLGENQLRDVLDDLDRHRRARAGAASAAVLDGTCCAPCWRGRWGATRRSRRSSRRLRRLRYPQLSAAEQRLAELARALAPAGRRARSSCPRTSRASMSRVTLRARARRRELRAPGRRAGGGAAAAARSTRCSRCSEGSGEAVRSRRGVDRARRGSTRRSRARVQRALRRTASSCSTAAPPVQLASGARRQARARAAAPSRQLPAPLSRRDVGPGVLQLPGRQPGQQLPDGLLVLLPAGLPGRRAGADARTPTSTRRWPRSTPCCAPIPERQFRIGTGELQRQSGARSAHRPLARCWCRSSPARRNARARAEDQDRLRRRAARPRSARPGGGVVVGERRRRRRARRGRARRRWPSAWRPRGACRQPAIASAFTSTRWSSSTAGRRATPPRSRRSPAPSIAAAIAWVSLGSLRLSGGAGAGGARRRAAPGTCWARSWCAGAGRQGAGLARAAPAHVPVHGRAACASRSGRCRSTCAWSRRRCGSR